VEEVYAIVRNDFTFIERLKKLSKNPRCSIKRRLYYSSMAEFLKDEAKWNWIHNIDYTNFLWWSD
jgi:hypothetical protein